jgi:hypothetical protein
VGSLHAKQMTWLRSADASMVLAIEVARICLVILGCVAAGWVVGFGMGYRRGVNDAMTGDIVRADHRIHTDQKRSPVGPL